MSENNIPTWDFKNTKLPLFVANKNDSIGIQIKHPVTEKVVGVLNANFTWERYDVFMNHLRLDFKDVRDTREGITETHLKNITRQNANLFEDICIGGSLIKINEFSEHSDPIEKSFDQMMSYPTEIKANLIDQWLSNFFIERHFPEGEDELDMLLGNAESIFFACKIGTVKNPSSVILMEFTVPSEDARRDYDDNVVDRSSKTEGNNVITTIDIKHDKKMSYAKRNLRFVQGAAVEKDGQLVSVSDNPDALNQFKDNFNPEWFVRLGDALNDTFNIGGK